MKTTSCLVNPRACHETMIKWGPASETKNIAVVGAGPARLAYATVAAERGHAVTLFDAADEVGGQSLPIALTRVAMSVLAIVAARSAVRLLRLNA